MEIKRFLSIVLPILYPYSISDWLIKKKKALYSLRIQSNFKACDITVRFGNIGQIKGYQYISIGKNTRLSDWLYLTAWDSYNPISDKVPHDGKIEGLQKDGKYIQHLTPELTIGEKCNFGTFNHITCTNRVQIGNGVLTGKWVTITDNSHGATDYDSLCIMPSQRPIVSKGSVVIEDNVWIGDKATILPGVHVGEGAVIAANSVVTKDVPPYCVVAGNPAKIIKQWENNN